MGTYFDRTIVLGSVPCSSSGGSTQVTVGDNAGTFYHQFALAARISNCGENIAMSMSITKFRQRDAGQGVGPGGVEAPYRVLPNRYPVSPDGYHP